MAIERLTITNFLQRAANAVVLDVRSPAEYDHAHIPEAVSLPLFTDEERKIVGTTYKQQSRELAIKAGMDIFGPKMRAMVEEAERITEAAYGSSQTKQEVYLYCWRGGMRSAAVAWLLDLYGFKVCTLAGGYKAFRNYVLQSFEYPYPFRIVGGFTGSGKTELLNELKSRGEAVIDLEQIAAHKGSAFGSLGMPDQPGQEMFENLLGLQLVPLQHQAAIWVEDESQRIGNVNIPGALWKTMRQSPLYFLDIPFEERLEHITIEYGQFPKERLIDCTLRIRNRLGGLETKNTVNWLEQGEIKEAFRILLRYYDKFYLKSLHNRENLATLLTKVNCATAGAANAQLLLHYHIV